MTEIITQSEWLAELERLWAVPAPGDAPGMMTANEIMAALSMSKGRVYRMLTEAKQAGRLEHARVLRKGLNDRMYPHDVYRLKPAPEA